MKNKALRGCLFAGEGVTPPHSFEKTGINQNVLVVGGTGAGKTVSVALPTALYTDGKSVIFPYNKKEMPELLRTFFEHEGYKTEVIDMADPENGTEGYDPLDFVLDEASLMEFLKTCLDSSDGRKIISRQDPYWENAAQDMALALIELLKLNEEHGGERATLREFAGLLQNIRFLGEKNGEGIYNLDILFEEAEKRYPGNRASAYWRSAKVPGKTAHCVIATLNTCARELFSENAQKLAGMEKRVDFASLGREKKVLFINTSPYKGGSSRKFTNLLYDQMFRVLFEEAQSRPDSHLAVDVEVICDDFACGSRIPSMAKNISIFRAAGLSVMLLLQSESQLTAMYGEADAATIIDNCDNYIYMGGMDYNTVSRVSRIANKSVNQIMNMKVGDVVVLRRGQAPVMTTRYKTLEDPLYRFALSLAGKGGKEPEGQKSEEPTAEPAA